MAGPQSIIRDPHFVWTIGSDPEGRWAVDGGGTAGGRGGPARRQGPRGCARARGLAPDRGHPARASHPGERGGVRFSSPPSFRPCRCPGRAVPWILEPAALLSLSTPPRSSPVRPRRHRVPSARVSTRSPPSRPGELECVFSLDVMAHEG